MPSSIPGLGVIIMAAGLGKRMKSALAKVLHPVAGRPMVMYVLDIACGLAEQGVAVVVGHQATEVTEGCWKRSAVRLPSPSKPSSWGQAMRSCRRVRCSRWRPPQTIALLDPEWRYAVIDGSDGAGTSWRCTMRRVLR